MGKRAAVALAAALLGAACSANPDRTPHPTSMIPSGGSRQAATPVTILGAGFLARVVQSSSGGPATVHTSHRAFLGGQELADVVWVDAHTLRATVPPGLPLGVQDLVVENAFGLRGALPGAWNTWDGLGLSAALDRATASVGQAVTLTALVQNPAAAPVQHVTVTATPSVPGIVAGPLSSAEVTLDPGSATTIVLSLTAAARGTVTLGVTVAGQAADGRTLAAAASCPPLLVQTRASLSARLAIPSTILTGATFQATLAVDNGGEAIALAVGPDPLALTTDATAAITILSGPTPASTDVAGGGRATFTWSVRLTSPGDVAIQAGARGVDANDGLPVVAARALSNRATQQAEAAPVASNPLGDGTPVAWAAAGGGLLFLGPSSDGSEFLALDPATGATTLTRVAIAVDRGATKASNSYWQTTPLPIATTFGVASCYQGSHTGPTCGPNGEAGPGAFAAGRFGGADRLVQAGASYTSRYLYVARLDPAPVGTISFAAVDLGAQLPNTATAVSSLAFAPSGSGTTDRFYAAVTDNAKSKSPYLFALSHLPDAGVLDAAMPADVEELGAKLMNRIGGAAAIPNLEQVPRIEGLTWFGSRLYVPSGHGVVRSTVAVPRSFATNPGDWDDATPGAAAWSGRTPVPAVWELSTTPADRPIPGVAAFGACGAGPCLFLARNVQGASSAIQGQLWRCDPGSPADPGACHPGDWSLVAPGADGTLSSIGAPSNGALSLLAASARYLYVGFDDATVGVQVFRAELAPGAAGDFRGRDGCFADDPSCPGHGGNGFGSPAVTRILDAQVAAGPGGRPVLYVVAGDATSPLRLYAIPE